MTIQIFSSSNSGQGQEQIVPQGASIIPIINDQLEKLMTQNFRLGQALQQSQRKTIEYENVAREQGLQVRDLTASSLVAAEKIEDLRGSLNKFMREREELFACDEDIESMGMEEISSSTDKNGNTRMHLLGNHVEKTIRLIERTRILSGVRAVKALVNTKNNKGETPLQLSSHKKVAEILISSGAKVNTHDTSREKSTPLHKVRDKAVAKLLIHEGADIDAKDSLGRTPLHTAHTVDILKLLIEAKEKQIENSGANREEIEKYVNSQDLLGRRPLHYAFLPEGIRLLVRNGADVNIKDLEELPPLHTVIHCQRELLTPLKSNYLGCDFYSIRPPCQAKLLRLLRTKTVRKNAAALIHTLCDLGAHIDSKDRVGNTLLHKARDIHVVSQALTEGADVNTLNCWKASPLHYACESPPEVIQALANHPKVLINQKDQFSFTPLGLCIAVFSHCNLFSPGSNKENTNLLSHAQNRMNTMQSAGDRLNKPYSSRPPRLSWMHWYYGMDKGGKAKRNKGWYK